MSLQIEPTKNAEYSRKHFLKNREKRLAASAEYYRNNREKYRLLRRANYENDRRAACARAKGWAIKNPEKIRVSQKNSKMKRDYGISLDEWQSMFEGQGSRCANTGCRATEPGSRRGWHTDHCHETGEVRGILCCHCNVMLGHARDSVERLRGAIEYLEAARA
jgi:hypothetical protein